MKILSRITFYGTLRGPIWWPFGAECTKDFDATYTPNDLPFTRPWTGLEDVLNHITNDGDFQHCTIDDLFATIQWIDGDYIVSKGVEFPPGNLINPYLTP